MIHPVFTPQEEPDAYPFLDLHLNLKAAAAQAGLAAVDLCEAYQGRGRDEVRNAKEDPWHPNALGHQLLADFLCRYLLARDWIGLRTRTGGKITSPFNAAGLPGGYLRSPLHKAAYRHVAPVHQRRLRRRW